MSQGSDNQTSAERVEMVVFLFRRLTDLENLHKVMSQVCEGRNTRLVIKFS